MLPLTSTIYSFDSYLTDGLFKYAEFPEGIDKQLVIDTILINAGEFEPIFKDAEFMQMAVTTWARKWYPTFERWFISLTEEYNPLHNYDRYEDIDEKHDNATTDAVTGKTTTKDVNTNTRSAYNSYNYEPHDRSDLDGSGSSQSDAAGTDKGTFERRAHLYGNIGVTTAAQMLEGEIEVRKYNLYNLISDCFANELCIQIY